MAKPRVLYWFRTDLRIHDSPALKAALDLNPEVLYPVWTWDPHYVFQALVGPNRWQFLLDCQNALSNSLTQLNSESKLLVIRESPLTILPKLFAAWKITHLIFEKDTDAYARSRDAKVIKSAEASGIQVITKYGRTLWDVDEIVKRNRGPTMTIAQLMKTGAAIGSVPRPISAPKTIPPPGDTSLDAVLQTLPSQEEDINKQYRESDDATYQSGLRGPQNDFSPPTLSELKMVATTPHRGGEALGLQNLERILKNKTYTANFAKPNTAPTDFSPVATTLLSPHMHFGSVSCRRFYWGAQDIVDSFAKSGKKCTQPPTSLTGQLLFREMYFSAQAATGSYFTQTLHNPRVRYLPWHLPSKHTPNEDEPSKSLTMKGRYEVDDEQAEEWFQRWKSGTTGFPWIDAVMTQLRTEGWIHHLARHAVACFLTRGGCYVDWERGADVFEEWLLDHEPACNAGNWQWLSCTSFFSQYHRIYSPITFPSKTDSSGSFVRHYLPVLKNFPEKYIYEPHKCPIADQVAAGCRIGVDYPKPMFDWKEQRERCLALVKEGFEKGLHGSDDVVIRGEARAMFRDAEGSRGNVGSVEEGKGGEAGVGAIMDNVVDPENERTVPVKKTPTKRGAQGTLDGMITRRKGRKVE